MLGTVTIRLLYRFSRMKFTVPWTFRSMEPTAVTATEQPSTPSARRARKPGTCPSSSKPTWCLLHHGCRRRERPQSCGMRNSDCGRIRSTGCDHRVSRPPKRSTRQVRLVDSTPGGRRPLHLSPANRIRWVGSFRRAAAGLYGRSNIGSAPCECLLWITSHLRCDARLHLRCPTGIVNDVVD